MPRIFSLALYSLGIWFYQLGIFLISPWNSKAQRWIAGRRVDKPALKALSRRTNGRRIWMHCASLGEFEQGRPILEELRKNQEGLEIVLTFFSPSGLEAARGYPQVDHIFYLPMDSPKNAVSFLDLCQPDLVIWVKYEYWFYYLHEIRARKLPALLVSAVFLPGQPFFKWYGGLHREMLKCFTHLFVQNASSAKWCAPLLGEDKITVSGDTRFDRVIAIAERFTPIPFIDHFCNGLPVVVAGSTWQEDEELLEHYANIHPDIRFILAPHEIDPAHLLEIEKLFPHSIRYSTLLQRVDSPNQLEALAPEPLGKRPPNVLIIDNIGMLSRLYQYATIAYVGGGFGDDGVHNVLEAAVFGHPVLYGPVIDKYFEAIELMEAGGAWVVENALDAESTLDKLFNDKAQLNEGGQAAKDYVFLKKGATQIVTGFIYEKRLLTS